MADVEVVSMSNNRRLMEKIGARDFEKDLKSCRSNCEEIEAKLEALNDSRIDDAKTTPSSSSESSSSHIETDDGDDSENEEGPSLMLKTMIEKHEAIEKTVSLIKKGIIVEPGENKVDSIEKEATHVGSPVSGVAATGTTAKPVKEEFDQLNNLLSDNKVQDMIRVVGVDTQSVIDRAMRAINSSKSLEEKRTAFSLGLRKLQMNLSTKTDQVNKDPNYNMAMNLVGLNRRY